MGVRHGNVAAHFRPFAAVYEQDRLDPVVPSDGFAQMMQGPDAAKYPERKWIIGRGWHQEKWDRPAVPSVTINPAVATIGDMENDLPMFARSGVSFAMGNAADGIKQHATHVTDSNERDGFAGQRRRAIFAAFEAQRRLH